MAHLYVPDLASMLPNLFLCLEAPVRFLSDLTAVSHRLQPNMKLGFRILANAVLGGPDNLNSLSSGSGSLVLHLITVLITFKYVPNSGKLIL